MAPESAEDAVGPVVESFLARFRRGERPALTELVARHPELAEQLRGLIPALVELEQLGGPTGSISATSVGRLRSATRGIRRAWATTGSSGGSAAAGWAWSTRPSTSRSRAGWRLKVMHPRFRADEKYLRRFHVEARSAAGLHHTNIVSVFDYGEQGGVCYYAMQYIDGQPLDEVLADLRRLRDDGRGPLGPALPISTAPRSAETAPLARWPGAC